MTPPTITTLPGIQIFHPLTLAHIIQPVFNLLTLSLVIRDHQWQHLPLTLVVEGDVVGRLDHEKAPIRMQSIEPGRYT